MQKAYLWFLTVALVAGAVGCDGNQPESISSPAEPQQPASVAEEESVSVPTTGSAAHVKTVMSGQPERWEVGKTYQLALKLSIDEGWHINANPASLEYLIATKLSFENMEGVKVEEIEYPEGHPFTFAQLEEPISVYEGDVEISFKVSLTESIDGGTRELKGKLTVQACDDKTCLSPSAIPLRLRLTGGASSE